MAARGVGRTWVIALLLCLGIQEACLRFAFPLPDIKGFNRVDYMPIGKESSETRAIRSIEVVQESSLDRVSVTRRLNEYGFRGRRWETRKAEGVVRVFFVGDSFVEGALVQDGETIPEIFQARSATQGIRVEALNLGVSGGGLESELRLIVDAAPVWRPDLVFLVIYANDLPDQPELPRPKTFAGHPALKPRFIELATMALGHEELPYRWGWRKVRFDYPVPNPNNPWSDQAFEEGNLRHVSPRILTEMRAGRFNAFRVGGSLRMEKDLQAPFDLRDTLGSLRAYLERLEARLVVVYIPERGTITNYYKRFEREFSLLLPTDIDMTQPAYHLHRRLLRLQCAERGVPFFDSADLVKREEDAGRHLYFDYDDHLNGAGNRVLGDALLGWLAGAPDDAAFGQSPGRLKMWKPGRPGNASSSRNSGR